MSTMSNKPLSPTARRAQMMREAWRPVGTRMSHGLKRSQNFLVAHPPWVQGIYYILTGIWPWVSINTFQMITGDKTDLWLVKAFGALIVVIGAVLCVAAYFREVSRAILCLALGSAAALAFIDVLFVSQGHISPIYLLDAILEVGLIVLWVYAWRTGNILFVREPIVTAQTASDVPMQPAPAPASNEPATQPGPMTANPAPSAEQTTPSAQANETLVTR